MPNVATVEFIGICQSPSAGKQWWGPDGSLLQGAPYVNASTILRQRADRNVFEIVWKVSWPNPDGGGKRFWAIIEGTVGAANIQTLDRYGHSITGLRPNVYSFLKSRKKTTLKLGIKVGAADYQWITFTNISLVPGKNPGFQMK